MTQIIKLEQLGSTPMLGGFNEAHTLHVLIRQDTRLGGWVYDISFSRANGKSVYWNTELQDVSSTLKELKMMIESHVISAEDRRPLIKLEGLSNELIERFNKSTEHLKEIREHRISEVQNHGFNFNRLGSIPREIVSPHHIAR